jgi:cytochrome c553
MVPTTASRLIRPRSRSWPASRPTTYAALRAYKITGNPNVGRANAIMGGQVAQYKDAELKAIAKYLSSLPSELSVKPNPKFR